jgi:hypothetical protein
VCAQQWRAADAAHDAKAVGGYVDAFPPDCEIWTLNLCESCLAWLVTTFAAYPAATDYEGDPRTPNEQMRALLVEGKTDGVYPKLVAAYARAMSRASIDPKEPNQELRRATDAARDAALTIAQLLRERREEWRSLSAALDAAGAPRLDTLEDRARALAVGRPRDRMLDLVEALYRSLYARWEARVGVSSRQELQALEDAEAMLSGAGREIRPANG